MTQAVLRNGTWTYGYWGGGGWSQGEFLPANQLVDQNFGVMDGLDQIFKVHDIGFENVMTTYTASDQKDADIKSFWQGIILETRVKLEHLEHWTPRKKHLMSMSRQVRQCSHLT